MDSRFLQCYPVAHGDSEDHRISKIVAANFYVYSHTPPIRRIPLCCPILLTGCTGKTIKIRTYIDGTDVIKIQGNKVWYEHESYDLPGRWQGRDGPTMINGKNWMPVWQDKISDPYEGLEPAFAPKSRYKVKVTKTLGRGDVSVTEWPSASNKQTLAVRIVDDAGGADWYEVTIKWK